MHGSVILRFEVCLRCLNVSWSPSLLSEDSDLRQQLAALIVGQKLKLTVDTVDSGARFKSDNLAGATIIATENQVIGEYLKSECLILSS